MDLEASLDRLTDNSDFSGVISIRQGSQSLYEKASGFADRSGKIANQIDTRFGIASGTKFFTALAIGMLIEEGKLSPGTLLRDCVKVDFPLYADDISVEHLLTHTSGIPDYYDEEEIVDFNNFTVDLPWYELKGPRDYLAIFPKKEMLFSPGERFRYSNGGYILLGVIVEELSGCSYQKFVEENLFQRAGMDRSGYFAMNRLPEKTALGYIDDESGWRTNIYNLPIVGASDGGAFSTVADIETLWHAFWGGKIISKERVSLFSRSHVRAGAEEKSEFYGFGLWLREKTGADREVYFAGCDAGVSFQSTSIQAADLLITVLSNSTDGAWPVLREIESLFKR